MRQQKDDIALTRPAPRKPQVAASKGAERNDCVQSHSPIHSKQRVRLEQFRKIHTEKLGEDEPVLEKHIYLEEQAEAKKIMKTHKVTEIGKERGPEKNTVLQIAALYKKSFKYNTTIHQIVKNLAKINEYNIKTKRETAVSESVRSSTQGQQPKQLDRKQVKMASYESEKKTAPLLPNLRQLDIGPRCPKADENLCIAARNNLSLHQAQRCHVNQLHFQGSQTAKATDYNWRSTYFSFCRYNTKNPSKIRCRNRGNLSLDVKENKESSSSIRKAKNLQVITENEKIEASNPQIASWRRRLKQLINKRNQSCEEQKDEHLNRITSMSDNKKIKMAHIDKKISFRLKNLSSCEFVVEGWDTQEKDVQHQLSIY